MKNYYMSIIDYSEVRFLTGDITANEDPDRMLAESGILTAKGNPSQAEMRRINTDLIEWGALCAPTHRKSTST